MFRGIFCILILMQNSLQIYLLASIPQFFPLRKGYIKLLF